MKRTSTNEIIRRHDSPGGRFYEQDGIYRPSVTTVIDAVISKGKQFLRWMGDKGTAEAERIGKEAMERGTRVHINCEALLKGLPYMITPQLIKNNEDEIKMLMGFILWYRENSPEIIETEKMLFHPNHPAAGAADIICKIDGEHWVVDIKTGNHYNTHQLQLTAYGWLVKDIFGLDDTPKIGVLRLYNWKGKPKYDFKEYKYADSEWTAANILYRWIGISEPSKLPKYPETLSIETDVSEKLELLDDAFVFEPEEPKKEEKVVPVEIAERTHTEYGNVYRKSGQILRKKKTKSEYEEMLANKKVPKSSIWKPITEED